MTQLSPEQVAALAASAGFTGQGLVTAVAVALAESGGRTDVVGVNRDGSRDRGLWKINDKWHPDVTDAMAFNPSSNAAAAYRISSGGTNWRPWSTMANGSARAQQARAQAAVQRARLTGTAVPTGIDIPDGLKDGLKRGLLGGLPGNTPGGALLGDGVPNPLGAIKTLVSFVGKTYEWISDVHNWIRIAAVVGGSIAVLVGASILAGSGALGGAAQSAADVGTGAAKIVASRGTSALRK